ncbi:MULTISPECIES: hypothetical protein [unclassified Duganella]|uniref:hypothetical protein n=1 Tax=unclassified Duganella TaxID=2636909 RepID=UPI0006F6B08D|nr:MULTISPECIES: hypothetical protein [unclassified Duganella]KQV46450.1 hypothetical protein ASD07_13290 [Duganella sp. Root336D2]KRC02242.1 hypothetical protein ASE26_19475 [Duganella sp. Root198D2]
MKRLQCLPLAAAVAAAAPGDASAGEDWVGGFVLGAQERTILQDTPLNRDNFLDIAGKGTRAVVLFEGRQQDITWRVRTEALNTDRDGTRSKAVLQELNRVFELGEGASLSLGKRLYALDPSYINQPLGFLQKRTDLSDPLDTLGNSEGIPMAVLAWSGARASVAALHARQAGGRVQSILKFGYEFDAISAGMVLRRAHSEDAGIGATISAAPADALSWYASAYRAGGASRYTRATAGIVLTPSTLPKLQLEYAYNGQGMADDGYEALRQQAQSNLPPHMLAKLASRLPTLGARQHYGSLTVSKAAGAWDVGAGVYLGLDDSSRVWHVQTDYAFSARTHLMFSAMRQEGKNGSERALSPVKETLALRLRHAF